MLNTAARMLLKGLRKVEGKGRGMGRQWQERPPANLAAAARANTGCLENLSYLLAGLLTLRDWPGGRIRPLRPSGSCVRSGTREGAALGRVPRMVGHPSRHAAETARLGCAGKA